MKYAKKVLYEVISSAFFHFADSHSSLETSRSLHGIACASEGNSSLRSSGNGKDAVGKGDCEHMSLYLLQHQCIIIDKQMGKRGESV